MSIQNIVSSTGGPSAIAGRAPGGQESPASPGRPAQLLPASGSVDSAARATAVAAPSDSNRPDPARINEALKEVREAIAPVAQNLLFSIDDDTGHTVIKIIDSSTHEVIKQIPSEEILAIAKALDKLQGLLIKQDA